MKRSFGAAFAAVLFLLVGPVRSAVADPDHPTGHERACSVGNPDKNNPHCDGADGGGGGGDDGVGGGGGGGGGGGQDPPTTPGQPSGCQWEVDCDDDLVLDRYDNCPTTWNPDQRNTDGRADGGDACDGDDDDDGRADQVDNCPTVANPDQANSEPPGKRDRTGDACDDDDNGNLVDDRVEAAAADAQARAQAVAAQAGDTGRYAIATATGVVNQAAREIGDRLP
jgi:hypothetical protein